MTKRAQVIVIMHKDNKNEHADVQSLVKRSNYWWWTKH